MQKKNLKSKIIFGNPVYKKVKFIIFQNKNLSDEAKQQIINYHLKEWRICDISRNFDVYN